MLSKHDAETIMNFTRYMWRTVFKKNINPPFTFLYDPQSTFTGMLDSFSHVAHDYARFDGPNPDDFIYFVDPKDKEMAAYIENIDSLQKIECLVIGSFQNDKEINHIIDKVISNGLIIVLNDVYLINQTATQIKYDELNTYGWSKASIPNFPENNILNDKLKQAQIERNTVPTEVGFFKKHKPVRPSSTLIKVSGGAYFKIWLGGFLVNTLNPGVLITWLGAVTIIASRPAHSLIERCSR